MLTIKLIYLNVIHVINVTYWRLTMVSVTLSVPNEMKNEMDQFQDINWSAVARAAIKNRLIMLKKFKEFTKDSTVTEEDALKWGREVSAKAMKKHN